MSENAAPPPANGSTPPSSIIPKNALPPGVREAAGDAVNRHVEKRGRGRPPGSGKKNPGAPLASATPPPPETPPIDVEFIRKAFSSGLGILDGFIVGRIRKNILKIAPGADKIANEVADSVRIGDEEKEMVVENIVCLAQKYNAAFRWAPEITMGLWTIGYGGRVVMALKEVEEIAETVVEYRRNQARNASQPPADQNTSTRT